MDKSKGFRILSQAFMKFHMMIGTTRRPLPKRSVDNGVEQHSEPSNCIDSKAASDRFLLHFGASLIVQLGTIILYAVRGRAPKSADQPQTRRMRSPINHPPMRPGLSFRSVNGIYTARFNVRAENGGPESDWTDWICRKYWSGMSSRIRWLTRTHITGWCRDLRSKVIASGSQESFALSL